MVPVKEFCKNICLHVNGGNAVNGNSITRDMMLKEVVAYVIILSLFCWSLIFGDEHGRAVIDVVWCGTIFANLGVTPKFEDPYNMTCSVSRCDIFGFRGRESYDVLLA